MDSFKEMLQQRAVIRLAERRGLQAGLVWGVLLGVVLAELWRVMFY